MLRADSRLSVSAGLSLYASWKCLSALTPARNFPSRTRPSLRWSCALTAFAVEDAIPFSSSSTRLCQSRAFSRYERCSSSSIDRLGSFHRSRECHRFLAFPGGAGLPHDRTRIDRRAWTAKGKRYQSAASKWAAIVAPFARHYTDEGGP